MAAKRAAVVEPVFHPFVPSELDWRARGKVTPVKDQDRCGTCWALSAVDAAESAYAIESGWLKPISEQEVVDCSIWPRNACLRHPYIQIQGDRA